MEINRPVAVYISYVHESSGEDKAVHDLAERLRRDGVDCRLDESPSFEKSILESDFVLVICSPGYYKRFFDQQTGKEPSTDIVLVAELLRGNPPPKPKFIPTYKTFLSLSVRIPRSTSVHRTATPRCLVC